MFVALLGSEGKQGAGDRIVARHASTVGVYPAKLELRLDVAGPCRPAIVAVRLLEVPRDALGVLVFLRELGERLGVTLSRGGFERGELGLPLGGVRARYHGAQRERRQPCLRVSVHRRPGAT